MRSRVHARARVGGGGSTHLALASPIACVAASDFCSICTRASSPRCLSRARCRKACSDRPGTPVDISAGGLEGGERAKDGRGGCKRDGREAAPRLRREVPLRE
jgi:hypothetical protein